MATIAELVRTIEEKDAEIARLTAACDAQGMLTQKYQALALDAAQAQAPVAGRFTMTPELRRELQAWGRATEGDEEADDALLEFLNAGQDADDSSARLDALYEAWGKYMGGGWVINETRMWDYLFGEDISIDAVFKPCELQHAQAERSYTDNGQQYDEPTGPNHPGHHDGRTCEAVGMVLADLGSQRSPAQPIAGELPPMPWVGKPER